MRNLRRLTTVAALAVTGSLAAAPAALAEDFECRGTAPPVVTGNLIVPDDAVCNLDGNQIDGSITVKSRATLNATGITVTGGIQAQSPLNVLVRDSTLANNVSIVKAGEPVSRDPGQSRI